MTNPPHDLDAERSVLGALVTVPGLLDTLDLDPQDFYEPVHERIFNAVRECWSEHHAVDPILLKDELVREGDRLPEVGGLTYLGDLVAAAPVAGDAEAHAAIVKRCAAARRTLQALTQAQQRIESGADPAEALAAVSTVPPTSTSAPRVVDHLITEFRAERPTFAWADRWLTNSLAIVSGRGGAGKSTYVLDKLAKATKGALPGEYQGNPVHVGLVGNIEDGAGPARLRLQAAGADTDLVHVPEFFGDDGQPEPFHIGHISTLQKYIEDHHLKIVMLDLINNLIHDDRKASDVRKVFPPLNQVAYATNCAIVGINHFRKSGGLGSDLMAGSAALRDNTRSLILMAEAEDGKRIATLDKLNLSTHQGESWEFSLQSVTIPDDNKQPTEIATVVELGESSTSVQEVVNRKIAEAAGQDDGGPTHPPAQQFIIDYLASHGGRALSSEIIAAGAEDGFSSKELSKARWGCKNPMIAYKKHGVPPNQTTTWSTDSTTDSTDSTFQRRESLESLESVEAKVTDLRTRQPVATCSVCGQPMTITEPGQTTHPGCEPGGAA